MTVVVKESDKADKEGREEFEVEPGLKIVRRE